MLYEIMLFGIGFLTACVLMAMLVPLIHARAVRLTVRRLLAGLPRSMVEMRAHKDQLRAEFAMSTRRLEMTVAEMQAKSASHRCEVAKKAGEIDRLKAELRKTHTVILRFQARELMRRSMTRQIVKLLIYLFERSRRLGWRGPLTNLRVTRGLDSRVHPFRKKMDCRVKPGNDSELVAITSP
jgi:hypothetical protein